MITSTIQIMAKKEDYRVKSVHDNSSVLLQGKYGVTLLNNVCNVASCHLTDIDPTIDHTLGCNVACLSVDCANVCLCQCVSVCMPVAGM